MEKILYKHKINTTENIAARLTLFGNNASINSPYRHMCIEAADRLNSLQVVLGGMLEDTRASGHSCSDNYCPILQAMRIYCLGKE